MMLGGKGAEGKLGALLEAILELQERERVKVLVQADQKKKKKKKDLNTTTEGREILAP